MKSTLAPKGWVLYDDSCGFCRRWIPFWAPTLQALGYEITPLQTPWVRARLGFSEEALLEDILLLLADGTLLRGAAVYRYFLGKIWWAYPFYLLACAPGGRRIFDWGYRTFARNRHGVSAACGWKKS